MILQQNEPSDFVVATGEQHSVREFVEKAFHVVGEEIQYVLTFSHTLSLVVLCIQHIIYNKNMMHHHRHHIICFRNVSENH